MTTSEADAPRGPKRRWARLAGGAAVGVLLLFVPDCDPTVPTRPEGSVFAWNADAQWSDLEARFGESRNNGCDQVTPRLDALHQRAEGLAATLPGPEDAGWQAAETDFFEVTATLGGCPERATDLLALRSAIRRAAKRASIAWPQDRAAKDRLYRLLYGTRAAVEEFLLQLPPDQAPKLDLGPRVGSATPSAEIEGVRIHSGDLLVSRGGAPTSAFIARGNDYPGNFSHVALVHVDDATGVPSVIEAHIERGVAVANAEAYFRDKKLRILVLRLRPDHPALQIDPMLPHDAASAALREAGERHIPYDFRMDFEDSEEQFCSEVASANYGRLGVELWPSLSTFSSEGLARWMAAFGVEQLETHSPSDLEYAPALAVVAEWHDRDTLFDDHVDNAIIDAMLERAEAGASVGHAWWMLPIARTAKGYSWILNLFGGEGPVPEGMSATVALRATWLADVHGQLKATVLAAAESFAREQGYPPPYWELVRLAREGLAQNPV